MGMGLYDMHMYCISIIFCLCVYLCLCLSISLNENANFYVDYLCFAYFPAFFFSNFCKSFLFYKRLSFQNERKIFSLTLRMLS